MLAPNPGCSAAWLARLTGGQKVGGSNPPTPIVSQDSGSFFVYVLRSTVHGRRYVGSAQDVPERLRRHNSRHSKSTRSGAPWLLVHSEAFPDRSSAVRRELFLKSGVGRQWLDRQLG